LFCPGAFDSGLRKKQTARSAALRAAEAGKPRARLPVFIRVPIKYVAIFVNHGT